MGTPVPRAVPRGDRLVAAEDVEMNLLTERRVELRSRTEPSRKPPAVVPQKIMAAAGSVGETPAMEAPETRYTLSGDLNIAYQVVGEGSLDLVFIPSLTHHVELVWENPPQAQFFRRLASISRLLLFDKRGTGMSDRVPGGTLEVRMDDIRAVMDAAGSERAVLGGLGDGGPLCALFAATYPERTTALVLINTTPRFVRSPELPWLPTRAE